MNDKLFVNETRPNPILVLLVGVFVPSLTHNHLKRYKDGCSKEIRIHGKKVKGSTKTGESKTRNNSHKDEVMLIGLTCVF